MKIVCSESEVDFSGIILRMEGQIRTPLLEWVALRKKDYGYEYEGPNSLIPGLLPWKGLVGTGYRFPGTWRPDEVVGVELHPRSGSSDNEERLLLVIENYLDEVTFNKFLDFLDRL